MNNSMVKWLLIPVAMVVIAAAVASGVIFYQQGQMLAEARASIASLEEQQQQAVAQIAELESLTPELTGLADDISALAEELALIELNIDELSGQAMTAPVVADVVATVKPSVVAIDIEYTYYFFGRQYTEQGSGSGWIIDDGGLIVTNYHVIEGAESIQVTLYDGRTIDVAEDAVVADPANDLAVLKIEADNLTAATIGDSSALRVGDWVIAIGNSLGLGISAKEGIVSRLNVSLSVDGQQVEELVETSAAINAGNSGGPLVNMSGEVIGITSLKVASVGVEGLGYAISSNEAKLILDDLITQFD